MALLKKAGLTPPKSGDVHEVRDFLEQVRILTSKGSQPLKSEPVFKFEVNGRSVDCKLYLPDDQLASCLLFYCHGGGFRHGTLAGWDAPLRQLCRQSGFAILSIDYALAPEYVFPVAFEEVRSIVGAVIASGTVGDCTFRRFALGGDSAGANLAFGCALAMRDANISALEYLLLFYGVYSTDISSDSWQRLSGVAGHGLSAESMAQYWQSYLAGQQPDWRAEPFTKDFTGLPACRLIIGELDPLLDENIALEKRLEAAGVRTSLLVIPKVIHGIVRYNEVAPFVRSLLAYEAGRLRAAFHPKD